MQILQGLDGLRQLPPGTVLSIGNFDGVHRGHRHILARCTQLAPPRLTTPRQKEALLCQAGIDYLVILPPAPAVLNLSAEDFWKLLRDEVRPACLVEGASFNFGKDRHGTIEKLLEWTASS